MTEKLDLKTVVDASVSSIKPSIDIIQMAKLEAFLKAQPDVNADARIVNVRGSSDKTGASSGIVIFTLEHGGRAEDFVLRYAPMHNEYRIFAEYNIAGQFRLQRKLANSGMAVPQSRWVDPTGEQVGLPSFIMEAETGECAHGSAFTGGLVAEATDERRELLFDEALRAQGKVHAVDWQALNLEADTCSGEGSTPIQRYISWFWRTAEWTKPAQMERLVKARDWLIANQPSYHRDDYVLVHGDTGLGNYMYRDDRVVSILDWELSGVVAPAYDLSIACNLADFFRAAATPEVARIIPTDVDWVARYERVTGTKVRDFEYFRKMAVLPSLIVSLSMNRGMPEEMRAQHLDMLEPMWAVIEAR